MKPLFAQVVLDLSLEGAFDYSIPALLQDKIAVGSRVMVSFGPRKACGIVIALLHKTAIEKIKPISSLVDEVPLLGAWQIKLSLSMSQYYGCTHGQALFSFLPNAIRKGRSVAAKPLVQTIGQEVKGKVICRIQAEPTSFKADIGKYLEAGQSALIVVPDIYYLNRLKPILQNEFNGRLIVNQGDTPKAELQAWVDTLQAKASVILGTRSSVFAPIVSLGLTVVIDEDNSSFQQEQTPMYHARDVLLMRQQEQGGDVLFLSLTPSVELKGLVDQGICALQGATHGALSIRPKTIDLSNYKIVASFLSPPLFNAIDAALKSAKKTLLVLNRRGSYNVTRCVDCGYCIKCSKCDSPMIFVRSLKEFHCRYCTQKLGVDAPCPQCKKQNWKSFGMGVEQLQTQLKKNFPYARITSFEGEAQEEPKAFDILVSTQACLRLKGKMPFAVVALVDIDSALSKMQLGSSQETLSLVRQLSILSSADLLVQTRNLDHYVIKALGQNNLNVFYDEEMQLRRELGFAPFKHWVQMTCRSSAANSAQQAIENIYNALIAKASSLVVLKPQADAVFIKRGQYRFVMKVQGEDVRELMRQIKIAIASVKRSSKVIITFHIDA